MPEVKWIKIVTEFFDDEKISLIESMPDKDTILIIWIKLLTLAGKKNMNGYIFLTENIPYTDEMLSTIFKRPLNTIRLAFDIFKKFDMINYDEDGILQITNWEKHQNIEGMERIRELNRKRASNYRERLDSVGGYNYLKHYEEVYRRDKGKCVYCGSEDNLCLDHLIPLMKSGDNEIDNIVLACKQCNAGKSGRLLEDANYTLINKETLEQYKMVKKRLGITHNITHNHASDKNRIDKKREDKNKGDIIIIQNIFEFWQKILNHKKTKLTNDKIVKIRSRLKEGYTEEECKFAIIGCSKSDYHMGRDKNNPQGTVYDSIGLIFRNGECLERFISYNKKNKKPISIKDKARNDPFDWDKALREGNGIDV